jgi:hypothetical protein
MQDKRREIALNYPATSAGGEIPARDTVIGQTHNRGVSQKRRQFDGHAPQCDPTGHITVGLNHDKFATIRP